MATTTTLANNLHLKAGTSTYPNPSTMPQGIALNLGELILSVDVGGVSSSVAFDVTMQETPDGGAVWQNVAEYTFNGGTYTNRQGVVTGIYSMATSWDGNNGRVVVTVSANCTVTDITLTN